MHRSQNGQLTVKLGAKEMQRFRDEQVFRDGLLFLFRSQHIHTVYDPHDRILIGRRADGTPYVRADIASGAAPHPRNHGDLV